jgi:hypothetical protein
MTGDFRWCAGFRPPGLRPDHGLRRPAAEKRQGTKSREVGDYGDSALNWTLFQPVKRAADQLSALAS